MEERRATILRGCMLARQLEEDLDRIVNQPETLTRFCEDIIGVFVHVKSRQMINARQGQRTIQTRTGSSSSSSSSSSQLITTLYPEETSIQLDRTFQNPRNIKNARVTWIVRAPIPEMGDLSTPPEDGYSWKPYGSRFFVHFIHPRYYYKCIHYKLYDCPARKQAQIPNDSDVYQVIYEYLHTCQNSSAAQSPPPSDSPPSNPATIMIPPTFNLPPFNSDSQFLPFLPPIGALNFNGLISMGMAWPHGQGGALTGDSQYQSGSEFPDYCDEDQVMQDC